MASYISIGGPCISCVHETCSCPSPVLLKTSLSTPLQRSHYPLQHQRASDYAMFLLSSLSNVTYRRSAYFGSPLAYYRALCETSDSILKLHNSLDNARLPYGLAAPIPGFQRRPGAAAAAAAATATAAASATAAADVAAMAAEAARSASRRLGSTTDDVHPFIGVGAAVAAARAKGSAGPWEWLPPSMNAAGSPLPSDIGGPSNSLPLVSSAHSSGSLPAPHSPRTAGPIERKASQVAGGAREGGGIYGGRPVSALLARVRRSSFVGMGALGGSQSSLDRASTSSSGPGSQHRKTLSMVQVGCTLPSSTRLLIYACISAPCFLTPAGAAHCWAACMFI